MSEKDEHDIELVKTLTRNGYTEISDSEDTKDMQDTWFLTGLAANKELNVDAALQNMHQKMDLPTESRNISYLAIAATVSLLIAAFAVIWFMSSSEETPNLALHYQTSKVSEDHQLPDGSVVALNKFSSLDYDQSNPNQREIKLLGEAFFDVHHDAENPFIVTTSDLTIEVIGTQFNVKAYAGQPTTVTVKEGKVKTTLREKNETLILTAEDQIINEPTQPVTISNKVTNTNYLAWKTGLLEFKDSELPEVVARLEELYDIAIDCPENLSGCKLTAKFDNRDLNFILQVLEATLKIEIEKTEKNYTFAGKGC